MSPIDRALATLEDNGTREDEAIAVAARVELESLHDMEHELRVSIGDLLRAEKERLARIQEQSRKLSLEECVYWLVFLREPGPAYWATVGNAQFVENDGRAYANYAKHRGCSFPSNGASSRMRARKKIVLARLCFEAAKRIREAKR